MTSRNCLFNFKLFVRSLLQQKYLMIIHAVLLVLSTTIPGVLEYAEEISCSCCTNFDLKYEFLFKALSMGHGLTVILLLTVSFISVYIGFSHLYKLQSAVFFGAIPVKRSCMYITKLCACLVSVILPVLAVGIVNLIAYSMMDFEIWSFDYLDFASYGTRLFLKTTACVLLHYFLFTLIFAFSATVSGNGFAQFVTACFVCLVYPATYMTSVIFINSFKTWHAYFDPDLGYVFPFLNMDIAEGKHYFFLMVLGLIMALAGLVLYIKRKNEKSDEFYGFGFVKVIIKYYIAFGSAFLSCIIVTIYDGNATIAALITGCVFGIVSMAVLRGIFEKSFKAMFAKPKQLIIFVLVMVFVFSVMLFDIFGFDNRVGVLTKVEVQPFDSYSNQRFGIMLESRESLEIVRRMIESGIGNEDETMVGVAFGINGRPFGLERYIRLPRDVYDRFCAELCNTEEYRSRYTELIRGCEGLPTKINYNAYSRMLREDNPELIDALISDTETHNPAESRFSDIPYQISFGLYQDDYYWEIPVYGNFEKTIAVITEAIPEFKID